MLQLYLDGPKDKIFHIFSIEDTAGRAVNLKNVDTRYSYLNKKTLPQIKNAQKKALIETLKKKNIPFREFKIKKVSEQTLGQLFTYFIFEIVIIARIANINPFNQPAVEQVKVKTKNSYIIFAKIIFDLPYFFSSKIFKFESKSSFEPFSL